MDICINSIVQEDPMFLDALQSYYAPAIALLVFAVMVITGQIIVSVAYLRERGLSLEP